MRRALAGLIAIAAAAGSAQAAGSVKAPTITGAWTFVTEQYGPGCRLTGSMTIQPDAKSGALVCAFTAQEKCDGLQIAAKQSCTATRSGDKLVIDSTIHNVAPNYPYAPDNFELVIENSARMKGMLRSAHSAPAVFFRGDAPVS